MIHKRIFLARGDSVNRTEAGPDAGEAEPMLFQLKLRMSDVLIPSGLENAMSMQVQAERERADRLILGDSERTGSGEGCGKLAALTMTIRWPFICG